MFRSKVHFLPLLLFLFYKLKSLLSRFDRLLFLPLHFFQLSIQSLVLLLHVGIVRSRPFELTLELRLPRLGLYDDFFLTFHNLLHLAFHYFHCVGVVMGCHHGIRGVSRLDVSRRWGVARLCPRGVGLVVGSGCCSQSRGRWVGGTQRHVLIHVGNGIWGESAGTAPSTVGVTRGVRVTARGGKGECLVLFLLEQGVVMMRHLCGVRYFVRSLGGLITATLLGITR